MAKIDFGGVLETVVTREEFPITKAREVLKNETIAIIGYGVQGPAQALNMRDNGINVIIGQAPEFKADWDKAVNDGFVPDETLFTVEGGCTAGNHRQISGFRCGAADTLGKNKTLSNGRQSPLFLARFLDNLQRANRRCSSCRHRRNSLRTKRLGNKRPPQLFSRSRHQLKLLGFSGLYGRAEERIIALGIAIGSGYLFPTTFEHEVYSDLTGERGVLMGALAGIMDAQYSVLRQNGHSPSEAFNETVEELTQSLIRLVDENGMDWMYSNCSATAQRGALDWRPKFMEATLPVFKDLYEKVKSGVECERVIRSLSSVDYKQELTAELNQLGNSEMWKTGAAVRKLRPVK